MLAFPLLLRSLIFRKNRTRLTIAPSLNAVEHDEKLAANYRALVKLFDMHSGAIAEGMARARNGEVASVDPVPPVAPLVQKA